MADPNSVEIGKSIKPILFNDHIVIAIALSSTSSVVVLTTKVVNAHSLKDLVEYIGPI